MSKYDELFSYSPETGGLIRKPGGRGVKAGSKVGSLSSHGYVFVYALGKYRKAHSIIWEMHNGPIPEGMEIDHINSCRSDNRIENLRLVTHPQNMKKLNKYRSNTSGVTGVSFHKQSGKWQATIRHEGKKVFLGLFTSIEQAADARKSAERLYSFDEAHGS